MKDPALQGKQAPASRRLWLWLSISVCAVPLLAQCAAGPDDGVVGRGDQIGITLKRGARPLFGSAARTTRPATIDFAEVERSTPEIKTIRAEAVREGSSRYDLLQSQMRRRIWRACRTAAMGGDHDCIVRSGDVADANGLEVADVTDAVVAEIGR